MRTAFSFFLRLFVCLVAAKFLLRVLEVEGRAYLLGLTALFLANVYWFDYLEFRDRIALRLRTQGSPPTDAPPETEKPPPNIAS
jgi:hypothetical protein